MSTEQHIYAGNCPDELDRTRRDPGCAGCRKLAPMAEQDERALSEGEILALADKWGKEPGWCEFDRNDFVSCIREAIAADRARAAISTQAQPAAAKLLDTLAKRPHTEVCAMGKEIRSVCATAPSAQPAAGDDPVGWRLVPLKPTGDMLDALLKPWHEKPRGQRECLERGWAGALAATHQPARVAEPVRQAVEDRLRGEIKAADFGVPEGYEREARNFAQWLAVHRPQQTQGSEPAMADALAAGDSTLHGAIDHWHARALAAEAKLGSESGEAAAYFHSPSTSLMFGPGLEGAT